MTHRTIRILLLIAAVLVALVAFAAPGSARDGSDDDDIRGTIASFSNGVLTIRQSDGDEVRGRVTRSTEIECERAHRSRAAHDDDDDHGGRGRDHGEDDDGRRRHDDRCGTRALKAGRFVREAELRSTGSGQVFREIELLR